MDQNFQTSFIPKKPMIEERVVSSRPVSLLTIISIFIFFTMLLATGGLYFYKAILEKNITQMKASLVTAKSSFEPEKITQLQILDKRLQASKEILQKHVVVSPVFDVLSKVTIKTIRYTKFSYSLTSDNSGKVMINMSGVASWTLGYKAIALQSDIFAQNKDYKDFFIDPVFSNLAPDAKGNILFDLNFSVNANSLNYTNVIKAKSNSSQTSETTSQGTTN